MRLPNLQNAFIEESKLTNYLLSEEYSGGKAGSFAAFGFSIVDWEKLRDALLQHAEDNKVVRISETLHGVKYIIEGNIITPDDRSPLIRAIWIVDAGQDKPRLVTQLIR